MNTYNLPTDKVPAELSEVVQAIQDILGDQAYDFLLIGAAARDLILDGQYGLGTGRKTLDVDFAIFVPEWGTYQELMEKLLGSGMFEPTQIKHRLMYKGAIEVDLVPFGDIQDEQGEYQWPPDFLIAMNVAGFVEISNHGVVFQNQEKGLSVKVAPIQGIGVMKLFAWRDRKHRTDKDGKDMGFILGNYVDLKYEVLYEDYEDVIEADDFDTIISGARIMGRDMHEIIRGNELALGQLKKIIGDELVDEDNSLLARTMSSGSHFSYDNAYRALQQMLVGLEEGIKKDGG